MAETKIVLVIDDDPDIIETVHTILSAKGYVVISASSGKQGFEIVQKTNPDLVLCDMMMEAIDSGMQTAQQIKQVQQRDTRVSFKQHRRNDGRDNADPRAWLYRHYSEARRACTACEHCTEHHRLKPPGSLS